MVFGTAEAAPNVPSKDSAPLTRRPAYRREEAPAREDVARTRRPPVCGMLQPAVRHTNRQSPRLPRLLELGDFGQMQDRPDGGRRVRVGIGFVQRLPFSGEGFDENVPD